MLLLVLLAVFALLFARAVQLQLLHADFYNQQGLNRQVRTVEVPAHRGVIRDRHGQALAISTPVHSVWAHPKTALENQAVIKHVSKVLGVNPVHMTKKLKARQDKQFMYLKRHVLPEVAEKLSNQETPGIFLVREYRRYYPAGEIAAHIVGLTNIDDQGLEGVEFAFDKWLHGVSGKKKVLKDGVGTVIADIELVQEPRHGKDLNLSIDKRIQYLAHRELKRTIAQYEAGAGSIVVLSAATGEVLAMANLPVLNPNDRANTKYEAIRNRAITDVFEPGSTIKPFLVAAALEKDGYKSTSRINTSPGHFEVGELLVKDVKNYGLIDMQTMLAKSSNVGAVRLAFDLGRRDIWSLYQAVGFGKLTGSGFPGERAGKLDGHASWSRTQRATLAYGYGISVTALQLARAYSVIANDGILKPVSFVVTEQPNKGHRVMSVNTARSVRHMLKAVVAKQGTGSLANMQSYSAAGKTGTSKKFQQGEYLQKAYISLFAGMAPADQPEVVVVVVIDQPTAGGYYGGLVAAPLFSKVAEGTLRLMSIPPDRIKHMNNTLLIAKAKANE